MRGKAKTTEVVYLEQTAEDDRARLLINYYRLGGQDMTWFDTHVIALLGLHHVEFRMDYTSRSNRGEFRAA